MIIPFIHHLPEGKTSTWTTPLQDALDVALPGAELRLLRDLSDADCAAAEMAVIGWTRHGMFERFPNLIWGHALWAGIDGILPHLGSHPMTLVRMDDPQLAETMAEAVLAWTLYLHRDMPRYAAQQRARSWKPHDLPRPEQRHVAIFGLGKLGQRAAIRLRENGFTVTGWSRRPVALDGIRTFAGADSMAECLQIADIAVLLLPLTPQTRGLFDAGRIQQMKPGAAIMNFARGPIIDEAALITALDGEHLSHAVLDVFEPEPLREDSPLWTHPSITVLPHISGPTDRETASALVARRLAAYVADGTIPKGIDKTRGY